MGRDSAVLASGGSWFHHWGARTEKGFDWAEWELPSRVSRTECSGSGVGFEHSLKVGRGSSSCCSVGKHNGLIVDVSFDWKPVECAEEQGNIRELGKVENQAAAFWISCRGLMAQVGSPANNELQLSRQERTSAWNRTCATSSVR
jgi:hypothetical protein